MHALPEPPYKPHVTKAGSAQLAVILCNGRQFDASSSHAHRQDPRILLVRSCYCPSW